MNNNKQKKYVEKSNSKEEKRVWISPKLEDWENTNIEFHLGGAADGGVQTYNIN
ncbi:hypothetical protein G9H61_04100 [Aquirufa ecclesiirivi]|uniref:Uncharacterized protein n=1 Tax=Aquirufa ecclesiirivi TaxID=2715124 RepID=A0ABT4JEF9_9BACT|nr:hypothetical protein [Aquirufa ecclesiirivi]MCZ2474613.1 hypothetical protein [Aquirufa ecclesiirivi]